MPWRSAYESAIQSSESFRVVPITRPILVQAAKLRAASATLKLPDAIHVATAQLSQCDILLTNDERLKAARGLRVVLCSDALRK